jgi:hypothetical protein
MSNEEDVLDVRGMFVASTRLKAMLQKAKAYTDLDVSKFKLGKCYHLKADVNKAMLINAIVLNPQSAVPMAMGFLATVHENSQDCIPHVIDLAYLGKECFI